MTTNPPADAAKVSIIGAAKSRAAVLFQEYARNASYKEDDFVRAVGSFVRNINEALDPLEVEMATLLAAQASQIEALTKERDRLSDQVYELSHAPWPEWASKIVNMLREYGMAYDDEIDLPESIAEWLSDFDPADHARATAAEAKAAQLEDYYNSARIELADEVARRETAEAKAAKMREAIKSFERSHIEYRRAKNTGEQPRLSKAGTKYVLARGRLFRSAALDQEARP